MKQQPIKKKPPRCSSNSLAPPLSPIPLNGGDRAETTARPHQLRYSSSTATNSNNRIVSSPLRRRPYHSSWLHRNSSTTPVLKRPKRVEQQRQGDVLWDRNSSRASTANANTSMDKDDSDEEDTLEDDTTIQLLQTLSPNEQSRHWWNILYGNTESTASNTPVTMTTPMKQSSSKPVKSWYVTVNVKWAAFVDVLALGSLCLVVTVYSHSLSLSASLLHVVKVLLLPSSTLVHLVPQNLNRTILPRHL